MLTESEILNFIDEDRGSEKKQLARVGERYYEGEHDIKDYKLYFYDADGNLIEDTTRSNIKISHPFFTELVDQQVQYMLSADCGFIKSDIPELQTELDAYFNENEDFTSELYDTLIGCVSKGFDYMYAYKMYLFFDFAGYSDMAIGITEMFGYKCRKQACFSEC